MVCGRGFTLNFDCWLKGTFSNSEHSDLWFFLIDYRIWNTSLFRYLEDDTHATAIISDYWQGNGKLRRDIFPCANRGEHTENLGTFWPLVCTIVKQIGVCSRKEMKAVSCFLGYQREGSFLFFSFFFFHLERESSDCIFWLRGINSRKEMKAVSLHCVKQAALLKNNVIYFLKMFKHRVIHHHRIVCWDQCREILWKTDSPVTVLQPHW